MADLNIPQIVTQSIGLAKNEIGKSWKKIEPYAEHEFSQFAESVAFISKLHLAGKISREEFKARIEFQRMALNNVLHTIEGIGIITAQNTVNGILAILGSAIHSALGIALPV